MTYGLQVVNGFLFGTGLILASATMKVLFHFSFC
jgi:hypothetical protein